MNLSADFASHHIEGFAQAAIERGIPAEFKVPLISQITDDLWTGGWLPGVRLPDEFRFVVSLYQWGKYDLGPDTARIEIEMYDARQAPDLDQLVALGRIVNALRASGPTLVHCQAGLNRSALVAGTALILDGRASVDAVELMRAKRSKVVLCNEAFERFLLEPWR